MGVLGGIVSAILQILGIMLFKLYGWVVIVAILGYLIWQNRRREQWVTQTDHILLLVEVPKDNEKKELSAEQMFASLHGILRPKSELRREGSLQEHISLELAARDNQIQFYVWTPKHLKDFVEGQIYAQYPSVRIREGVEDYTTIEKGAREVYTTELSLTKDDVLPIKTFQTFEVDPLAGITAVLAKLEETGEEMWIQILARPIDDSWQDDGHKYIEDIKNGRTPHFRRALLDQLIAIPLHVVANFVTALASPPESADKKGGEVKLSTGQQAVIKAVESKVAKLGYQVKIRITYLGSDADRAKQRVQAIVGGFKQFNTTSLNGFTTRHSLVGDAGLAEYQARLFMGEGSTLNIEELASVYHLPHKSVETPNMVWTTVKTSEPPSSLPAEGAVAPEDVSLFGQTNFRGHQIKFGIKRRDRDRHMYIIGQTGTGKSKLLNLLTLSDIYHDIGLAIVDPHGDFATDMLQYIPEHRLKDVIYFNPTDRDFPIAFNPLEVYDPAFKNDISSEMIGVLKRMFDSWGPRLEYILRYTILALLDYPDSTMLGITRMLTEKEFRKKVIREIKDPVVKNFWVNEFASWNDKFANEAVAPVLNKVGAFTANPLIRNIIGQPKSKLDLRGIMDEGKILIVNLSRGQIGEDNASILGALMVTKIQLAAMSRANIPLEQRRPFYLYVDEFQNFATDSFATILSEARKYQLNLTVANQYIAQMPEQVRDAVFGNVGTMVSFRVGAGDGQVIGKYFTPAFEPEDLIKLNNQHIVLDMTIDGEKNIPFSATTLRMPEPERNYTPEMIAYTRSHYASARGDVEREISEWTLGQSAAEKATDEQATPEEQKPNTFLGNLKNPNPPAASHSSHGNSNRNRNRNRKSTGGQTRESQHRGQQESRSGERERASVGAQNSQKQD
ncbi:MAG TPA: DUF87 domain-containing protein [Candidatus Saccharimonadales bacterium]|nr:DUF87 domain-containing protein [Candidatus Saccharimonadales bacterium]